MTSDPELFDLICGWFGFFFGLICGAASVVFGLGWFFLGVSIALVIVSIIELVLTFWTYQKPNIKSYIEFWKGFFIWTP